MANKTKKRLVTGIACTVPAVIAVPSLLALTQCSNGSESAHVKLGGKTKKEMTLDIFEDSIDYEFQLNDVKDPTSIQVSLPNVTVNGNAVGSQKGSLYKAVVKANGVVTITFYKEKIIEASASKSNDTTAPYELKFDVNLKNSEINETLTGFSLKLVIPEYSVLTTTEHVTITCDTVCSFAKDFVFKYEVEDYYTLDKELGASWDILINGTSYTEISGYEKYITHDEETQTVTINGLIITGNIEIIIKAVGNQWVINQEGIKDGTVERISLPGIDGKKAIHGTDISSVVKYKEGGKRIAKGWVTCVDSVTGIEKQITATFDNEKLFIAGDQITGEIKLHCTWEAQTVNVVCKAVAPEGKTTSIVYTYESTVGIHTQLEIAFTIKQGHKINNIYAKSGSVGLNRGTDLSKEDCDYTVVMTGMDPETETFTGLITIKADKVDNDIEVFGEDDSAIVYQSQQHDDTQKHALFEKQYIDVTWGEGFTANLKQAVEGQETVVQRGYKVTKLYGVKDDEVTKPIEPTLSYMYGTDENRKYEFVTAATFDGKYFKDFDAKQFDVNVETDICKRTVSPTLPSSGYVTKIEWDVENPTIDDQLVITPTLAKGYDLDESSVVIKGLDIYGNDVTLKKKATGVENPDYEIKNSKIYVYAGHIVSDIRVTCDGVHHDYGTPTVVNTGCTWQNSTGFDKDHTYWDQEYKCEFACDYEKTFTSTKPEITVKVGDNELTYGSDYTFEETTIQDPTNKKGAIWTLDIPAHTIDDTLSITCNAQQIKHNITYDNGSGGTVKSFKLVDETTRKETMSGDYDHAYTMHLTINAGYAFTDNDMYVTVTNSAGTETTYDYQSGAWSAEIVEGTQGAEWTVTINKNIIDGAVRITYDADVPVNYTISASDDAGVKSYKADDGTTDITDRLRGVAGDPIKSNVESSFTTYITLNEGYNLSSLKVGDLERGKGYTYTINDNVITLTINVGYIYKPTTITVVTTKKTFEGVTNSVTTPEGYTKITLTPSKTKYAYGEALDITMNNIVDALKLVGTIQVGDSSGATYVEDQDYTITNNVISINANVIKGTVEVTATYAAKTYAVTSNIEAAAWTGLPIQVEYGKAINATIETEVTAKRYLVNRKVTINAQSSSTTNSYLTYNATNNKGTLAIPAGVIKGSEDNPVIIDGLLSETNLKIASNVCSGFYEDSTEEYIKHQFGDNVSLVFPASTTVAAEAFKDNTLIKSVNISNATSVATDAFVNCTNLYSISGASAKTTLAANVFDQCQSVYAIHIDLTDQTAMPTNWNALAFGGIYKAGQKGTIYVKGWDENAITPAVITKWFYDSGFTSIDVGETWLKDWRIIHES